MFAAIMLVFLAALYLGVYAPAAYQAGYLHPWNAPIIEAARQDGCGLWQSRLVGGRALGPSDQAGVERCEETLGAPLKEEVHYPYVTRKRLFPNIIVDRTGSDRATVKFQKDGAVHSSTSSFTVTVMRTKDGVWHAVDESGDIDGIWMP
jgi:hypothetical protein